MTPNSGVVCLIPSPLTVLSRILSVIYVTWVRTWLIHGSDGRWSSSSLCLFRVEDSESTCSRRILTSTSFSKFFTDGIRNMTHGIRNVTHYSSLLESHLLPFSPFFRTTFNSYPVCCSLFEMSWSLKYDLLTSRDLHYYRCCYFLWVEFLTQLTGLRGMIFKLSSSLYG